MCVCVYVSLCSCVFCPLPARVSGEPGAPGLAGGANDVQFAFDLHKLVVARPDVGNPRRAGAWSLCPAPLAERGALEGPLLEELPCRGLSLRGEGPKEPRPKVRVGTHTSEAGGGSRGVLTGFDSGVA